MTEATPLASEQITQEDREAAATLVPLCFGASDLWKANVLAGYYDDGEIVQAFARHRIAALSASPAPSGQGVSGEVAKCLTPGCKYRTEIKTTYAHSSYGPARLGITVFFPDWQSLKAGSASEVSHIETVLHKHMERAVSEVGQYDLSLGGDVAKDWPTLAAPAPSCAPGEVERVSLYREIDALGGSHNEDGEYNAGFADGYGRALSDALEILTKRGFTEAADDNQRYRGWVIEKAFAGWSFNHPDYDPDNAVDQRHGSAASIVEARGEIDRLLSDASEAEVIARCAEVVKARASELRGMANPVGHPFHGGIIDGIFDRQANVLEAAAADILAGNSTPPRDPRPDRNCDFCGPGWKGAHKYRCPRAHEDNGEGGPVDD